MTAHPTGSWTTGLCAVAGRQGVHEQVLVPLVAGIKKMFGDAAPVHRCVLHKRRNLEGHLPKELAGVTDKQLALIFAQPDATKELAAAKARQRARGRPSRRGCVTARRTRRHVHRPASRRR